MYCELHKPRLAASERPRCNPCLYQQLSTSMVTISGNQARPFTMSEPCTESAVYDAGFERTYPGGSIGSFGCAASTYAYPSVDNSCDGTWSDNIRVRQQIIVAFGDFRCKYRTAGHKGSFRVYGQSYRYKWKFDADGNHSFRCGCYVRSRMQGIDRESKYRRRIKRWESCHQA